MGFSESQFTEVGIAAHADYKLQGKPPELGLTLRRDEACSCGEIGIHGRFRSYCRKACRFESCHEYFDEGTTASHHLQVLPYLFERVRSGAV